LASAAPSPAPEVSFVLIFFGAINLRPSSIRLHQKAERATRVTRRANEQRSLFRPASVDQDEVVYADVIASIGDTFVKFVMCSGLLERGRAGIQQGNFQEEDV